MPLEVTVNGKAHHLDALEPGASLQEVVQQLDLIADRIAVERNGDIASRREWPALQVEAGDRLEIVHFVGGGAAQL